jgi:hypothetical protein
MSSAWSIAAYENVYDDVLYETLDLFGCWPCLVAKVCLTKTESSGLTRIDLSEDIAVDIYQKGAGPLSGETPILH